MSAAASAAFFSVPARFSGRVVVRRSRTGAVWAWRAVRTGERPSPACLFLPASSQGVALHFGACARFAGLRFQVKEGSACAVWSAGPIAGQCPPWACKVWVPQGQGVAQVKAALRSAAAQLALQGA